MAGDWVKIATGFDPIETVRGYRTEKGAVKKLQAAGFETARDLFESQFARVPVALAHRGDLGYTADDPGALGCPLIIDGELAVGMSPSGLVCVPRAAIVMAYAV